MYAKKNYAYDKFLSATNNTSLETLKNRDNRRSELKKLKEEIDRRGISPELSQKIHFSKKQKDGIEAQYLRGKDFRNFGIEEWTNQEKQINEKLKVIEKQLETCFNQDKANQLEFEKSRYIHQLEVCHKNGEKAMNKQILIEEKLKSEIESNSKNVETDTREESKTTNDDSEKQIISGEKTMSEAEEKAKIIAEEKAREQAIAEILAKEKAIAEAKEKARKEAENKKRFWPKLKEKIAKNWKKIVGPVLAALALGSGANALLNSAEPQKNTEKFNTPEVNELYGPEKIPEDEKDEINSEENDKSDENDFKASLKVEQQKETEFTVGDVIHIDEGCNYYENSMEGGKHNTIDTKNQWRQAGSYMIDGLAVTYQDNNGEWKIAKLKDDKTNGGNYGNLGINSTEYIKSVMQENGLTEEQVRVMYHINQGTKVGERPTGWIEAPKEGFELESKYGKTQEKTQENDELEK